MELVAIVVFYAACIALVVYSVREMKRIPKAGKLVHEFTKLWYPHNHTKPWPWHAPVWNVMGMSPLDVYSLPKGAFATSTPRHMIHDPAMFIRVIEYHGADNVSDRLRLVYLAAKKMNAAR